MSEPDLPFVQDAGDPDPDLVERARGRVQMTVRRRRARRRAVLVAVPAIALVLIGGAVVAMQAGDDEGQGVTAGQPEPVVAPTPRRIHPNARWDGATLSKDGRTLTVAIGSSPEGDGPCEQHFEREVIQTDDAVLVAFELVPPSATTTAPEVCLGIATIQQVRIPLDEPLGDRAVFDGISAGPRSIHRLEELVDATWLPEGFRLQGTDITSYEADDSQKWQQTFEGPEGTDWYVAVNQGPQGSFQRQGKTQIEPVVVHGIQGERYLGEMNGTMQTIHWVEGGLDISVWGEMQGPPRFTHEDELLRIAEGIRLPSSARGSSTSTTTSADATSTTVTPATVTEGRQTCTVVQRPTAGEGGVPTDDGDERLRERITWTNDLDLRPPPADVEPGVGIDGLHPVALRDKGAVTKLAILDDPLNRPNLGRNHLVWVRFDPQTINPDYGPPRTTTEPVHPGPCGAAVEILDATTGRSLSLIIH